MKFIVHLCNFANAPKYYIFIPMVNFSTDSLEIWRMSKKYKITFVWKHEYNVVINGCPAVSIRASFSMIVKDTHERLTRKDFFTIFTAKLFSDPSDDLFFASSTFPKPPWPKILTGWKFSRENFGWPILPLVSILSETQSFKVLLRHTILHRIYTCYNYNTIICRSWWWL